MTIVLALVRVPPSLATALIQLDEDVRARVTPREGDSGIFDGLDVLIFFGFGFGVEMMVTSHG